MKALSPSRPAVSSAPAPALAASLGAMQQDPVASRTLMAWQTTAADAVMAAIDSLTRQLAGTAAPPAQVHGARDHYDVIQARAQARRRQAHLEQCRQLAQDMVFASLHHLDDPHWDPLGERAAAGGEPSAPPPANLLAMLLNLPPQPF